LIILARFSDNQLAIINMNEQSEGVPMLSVSDLTIKVVYDNHTYSQGLGSAWGFSAFVTGMEKTILFDTGGNGPLLLDNMVKLAIDPGKIDVVVLSHIHADHTGGLSSLLERNRQIAVYLPKSFPRKFKEDIQKHGARLIEVKEPLKICEGVYSTGQIGKLIKEQSLVIRTRTGLIIMTGCAHPGIVKMVKAARDLADDDILLVLGGFHLEWATKAKIEKTISAFKQHGVRYVGPCHCTGEKARSLFEKHFGKNYVNIGAGRVINVKNLLPVQDA